MAYDYSVQEHKTGWWVLTTTEADLSDTTLEEIAELIRGGCTSGQIVNGEE
jgi:hypothetical protein